eukprot:jgi/Psemu1/15855/gm1.15855_g
MPVSVQETIEQELEHLHHRINVEEKSLELAVKKIANNKKYIRTKNQKFKAIKKVGDEMVIGFIRYRRQMRVADDIKLLTKLPLLHRAKTRMQDIALENEANNKNSLVKLPPQELNDPANCTCPFCSHSYVDEPEKNKRLVAKNRVASAEYELKLREYKANSNYVNTEGQNRNQKYFNVIVSRYLAPTSMGLDLAFLVKSQNRHLTGGDAISDADKENIDIGNANAGKAIASILAMSALEAHNAQVAVVAVRNGVSATSDQQFQETLYFQGATQNLMKDPTIDLSSLREYAGTAPNIALPENGGFQQRNNRLEESAVASSSSNDQGSLPMGPPAAKISPVPPATTISPLNATALTVPTLQSLGPFDPAPGLAMKKPPSTYPAAKKKGPAHKTAKSVGVKIFNSVSAAMYGTQRDDIIDIDNDDSVVPTLSFDQKPIPPKKSKATPRTALAHRARNTAISRAGTPVLNVDTDLPSSPESAIGKDTKKGANPEDLKRVIDQVYPFPSS